MRLEILQKLAGLYLACRVGKMNRSIWILGLIAGWSAMSARVNAQAAANLLNVCISKVDGRPDDDSGLVCSGAGGAMNGIPSTRRPIGTAECDSNVDITFKVSMTPLTDHFPSSTTKLDFWRGTSQACNSTVERDGSMDTCVHFDVDNTTDSNVSEKTLTVPIKTLVPCDTTNTYTIFVFAATGSPERGDRTYGTFTISVDRDPPTPPIVEEGGSGFRQLKVNWHYDSSNTGQTLFEQQVYAAKGCPNTDLIAGQPPQGDPKGKANATATDATLSAEDDLQLGIGEQATVGVASVDLARNVSNLSNTACLTRVNAAGYCEAFGKETGGNGCPNDCSVVAPGAHPSGRAGNVTWFLLALAACVAFRRSQRAGMFSFFFALGLFMSSSAVHADWNETYQESRDRESPEWMSWELRFGQYQPSQGDPAFKQFFGNDQGPSIGTEFDFFILRIPYVGRIGVGAGFFWAKYSGNTLVVNEDGTTTNEKTTEKTTLELFPISTTALLRVDVLARKLSIPVVFTGKIGAAYVPFNSKSGGVKVGSGVSIGMYWAVQAQLELDFIEPKAARALDSQWGINHTYVFGEVYGIAGETKFPVGDDLAWCAGLGFVF